MKKPISVPFSTTAILALAEIKAAVEAFDSGDTNVVDALDAVIVAVETHRRRTAGDVPPAAGACDPGPHQYPSTISPSRLFPRLRWIAGSRSYRTRRTLPSHMAACHVAACALPKLSC